ncbi:MAG TPA: hypothetical protein VHQ45_09990 [Gemmatimonadaceae bacterium]|jgi:hypothetical protein|nr:hypothetical protein [Gemmatimonadaceae bacterium]
MPEVLVPIALFAMIAIIAVGMPIARAFARRMDRSSAPVGLPLEAAGRLERMERAIDAIAVEVERISEGQRFTTRLLAERAKADGVLPPGGGPDRT